jgi:adenylate kinase
VGKGTHSRRLARDLGIPHIATGDMLRAAIAADSPLGQQAARHMNGGNLVPDEVAVALLAERLAQPDAADGYLLDGFPRTVPQAEALVTRLAAGTPGAVLSLAAMPAAASWRCAPTTRSLRCAGAWPSTRRRPPLC